MDLKNSILVRVLISVILYFLLFLIYSKLDALFAYFIIVFLISVIDILVLLFKKNFELFLSMLIWYSSLLGIVYSLIDNGYRIGL